MSLRSITYSPRKIGPYRKRLRPPSLLPDWAWPLLGFLLLLLVGAAALWDGRAGGRFTGPLLMLLGLAGLTWRLRKHRQEWLEQRAVREEKERRRALLNARRERSAQERLRRQEQKAAQAHAAARAAEVAAVERQARQQAIQEAQAHRAEQDRLIYLEADRLRRLDDAALRTEVRALFTAAGFQTASPSAEADCDLLLHSTASQREAVARCVPVGHKAGVADVQALEDWRQEIGAEHAYLLSLAGFSPPAVRLAQHLPLTLVEAHLLAQWKHTGKIQG